MMWERKIDKNGHIIWRTTVYIPVEEVQKSPLYDDYIDGTYFMEVILERDLIGEIEFTYTLDETANTGEYSLVLIGSTMDLYEDLIDFVNDEAKTKHILEAFIYNNKEIDR